MKKICCNSKHSDRPAAIYCKKCERYFCVECEAAVHDSYFSNHAPYVIRDFNTDFFLDRCEDHASYPLDFFCRDHFCLCCSLCKDRDGRHNGCNVVPLADLSTEEILRHITKASDNLKEKLGKLAKLSLDDLKSRADEFNHKISEVKETVAKTFSELRCVLNERESELMQEIERANDGNVAANTFAELSNTEGFKSVLDQATDEIKRKEEAPTAWDALKQKETVHMMCAIVDTSKRLDGAVIKALDSMCCNTSVDLTFSGDLAASMRTFGTIKSTIVSSAPQLSVSGSTSSSISLSWGEAPFGDPSYQVLMVEAGSGEENEEEEKEEVHRVVYSGKDTKCCVKGLTPEKEYSFRVQVGAQGLYGSLSALTTGKTTAVLHYSDGWKECPISVDACMKYTLGKENLNVATFIGSECATIVGSKPLQPNETTTWGIKILKSLNNEGEGIIIGMAPSFVNQNYNCNYIRCGWYLDCCSSKLYSGPPHRYSGKEYGPKKWDEACVHTGDIVGVAMNTEKGELSFSVNNVEYGVAFKEIPLDKPLVPCVLIDKKGDSVELL